MCSTHYVIAVGKYGDAIIAHSITTGAANQRVATRYHAAQSRGAANPSDRASVDVPLITIHHVITIAQRGDAAFAHLIIIGATHQRVGRGYHSANTRSATAPGHRASVAAPIATIHHVIAIAGEQSNTLTAHIITVGAANQ